MLWSVLIASLLPREKVIATFRLLLTIYRDRAAALENVMVEHSQLAKLTPEQFDLLFAEICKDAEVKQALLPLLLLESLPDRHHWSRVLGAPPDVESGFDRLARAVALCLDHQSQQATDCRWFRVMTIIAQDKMKFVGDRAELGKEIINYPDYGDMRKVRPSIRAAEMATRQIAQEKTAEIVYSERFWEECFSKTPCMPALLDKRVTRHAHTALLESVIALYSELLDHFFQTVKTTATDARHEGAFGLVFYILQLLFLATKAAVGQTIVGRHITRSAVEAYITLSYLAQKDDPTIWMQYRNYGAGQSKLAYLKTIQSIELPSYTSKELLEQLANEDLWLEFQDIKLGAWADKDLRKMSQEASVKDVYDRYYDGLSGYVHANWSAVRHAAYDVCLNPLHRFHRVPVPPRFFEQTAVPDLVKIANVALDRLNQLYPAFKKRLKVTDSEPDQQKPRSDDTSSPGNSEN